MPTDNWGRQINANYYRRNFYRNDWENYTSFHPPLRPTLEHQARERSRINLRNALQRRNPAMSTAQINARVLNRFPDTYLNNYFAEQRRGRVQRINRSNRNNRRRN